MDPTDAQAQNGHTPAPNHRVMIESDGTKVAIGFGCPLDVAEGILYRALSHVQREILLARLADAAAPKVELAGALPRHPGMV